MQTGECLCCAQWLSSQVAMFVQHSYKPAHHMCADSPFSSPDITAGDRLDKLASFVWHVYENKLLPTCGAVNACTPAQPLGASIQTSSFSSMKEDSIKQELHRGNRAS